MLKLENINKNFGSQTLFQNFSFALNKGEKIGLVGRNGHGKTTIFKMITGEIAPDEGSIFIPKNYTIGYLEQHILFTQKTVLDEAALGLKDERKYDIWRAEKILSGLGFSREDFQKDPMIFSGGYQLRINLAKVLAGDPDLLLLDEPNNYLDIIAIRWLENFLKSWEKEILLITHDRSFMDNIVTHTVCIHRQKAKKVEGTTEKIYAQIDLEEEVYEKTRLNEEKKRKQTEQFIEKFRAKASLAKMAQSRIKSLEKFEVKEKLENIDALKFYFRYHDFNAVKILEAKNLSFSYQENFPALITNFNLSVDKNDRIAIIGKNGKGKSTLLKLLSGVLEKNSGIISYHHNMKLGYFGQTNLQNLNEENTILEELIASDPENSIQKSRTIAGSLMFSGDLAAKKIKILSGGEKNRVMLGKILLSPCNILFLDEPTNHLDMDATEALLKAIKNFPGAVLMATHNEDYLKNFAKRLIVFDDDEVKVYDDSYEEFLEKVGWSSEKSDGKNSKKSFVKKENQNKNLQKKIKANTIQDKSKILNSIMREIKNLEDTLEILEKESVIFNEFLLKAAADSKNNLEKINEFSFKLKKNKELTDENYEKLEALYCEKEKIEQSFSEKI